jgi:hypothetical protein
MSTRWWRIIFDNATGLYIAGSVALGAIVAASLALDGGRLAAGLMRPQSIEAPWTEAIRAVDEALAAGDVSAAGRAWTEAYNAAQRSRRWEGLLAAGDAHVRINQAAGGGKASAVRARESYLAALWRARQKGSLEGVLQAAEAFDSLGDAAAAAGALRIAEAVAGRDPGPAVLARIAALRESWGAAASTAHREDEVLLVEP